MTVPRSLMTPDGTLISGDTWKSDLVKEVMRSCKVEVAPMLDLPSEDITCIAIDAMYVVNTITPKPAWIETGHAKEFLNRIDERSRNATSGNRF